jgi:hypothetical protein
MLAHRSRAKLGATVVVLVTCLHANANAAPPDKACSLLTVAEITAQVGTPGEARETEVPAGQRSASGQPTKMCTWPVGGGSVRVSLANAGNPETARQSFRSMMKSTLDRLKATGWQTDEKPFGDDAGCWSATPPASEAGAFRMTGCAGMSSGMGISVGISGPTAVDMSKVKKLLDAAMGRVH